MKLRVAIYMHVDINPKHYGLEKDIPVNELCEKMSEILTESGDDVIVLMEQYDSNVVVTEIKPGEEE